MRANQLFWGAMLVLFGGLLLLENLGLLPTSVWSLFWPLALIAFGAWMLVGLSWRRAATLETQTIPLQGAARARLKIRHGAGQLKLAAGDDPGQLAAGTFEGGVEVRTRREGDQAVVRLSVPDAFPGWGMQTHDWNVRLNRDVPLRLDVKYGAADAALDLTDLRVTDLELQTGASTTRLNLPAQAGQTRAEVKVGAATLNILIPTGVAARIRQQSGLATLDVDTQRFPRSGDGYASPDFDAAANRVELRIEAGAGTVNIR